MRRNKEQLISLKFIVFLLFLFIVLVLYISYPNDLKKLKENKSFDELLEYSKQKKPFYNVEKPNPESGESTNITVKNSYSSKDFEPEETYTKTVVAEKKSKADKTDFYKLLDELKQNNIISENSIRYISNKLLNLYGYPDDLTEISIEKGDLEDKRIVRFEIGSGEIVVNTKQNTDIKRYIAELAKEIDYMDKLANIRKSAGAETFKSILEDNKITNINTIFWQKAAEEADNTEFNSGVYTIALRNLLSINSQNQKSFYADFEDLEKKINNPIEISAENVYNEVIKYYKLTAEDNYTKEIVNRFKSIDSKIKDLVSTTKGIAREKNTIFDYLYAQAIIKIIPELNSSYINCINRKNGNLSDFWNAYEKEAENFHTKGVLNEKSYKKISAILEETEARIKKGITSDDILAAYGQKISTIAANPIYKAEEKDLREIITDYLSYIKEENITTDSALELKSIVILVCIENELSTSKNTDKLSLYYLKFPQEIRNLYKITTNKNKFIFLYNNPAFKSQKTEGMTDEKLLLKLIDENRLRYI